MLKRRAVLPSGSPVPSALSRLSRRCATAPRSIQLLVKITVWACVFHLAAVGAVMASMLVPDDLVLEQLVDARRSGLLTVIDHSGPPFGDNVEWGSECCMFTQNIAFEGAGLLKRFAFAPNLCYCSHTNKALEAYERGEDFYLRADWRYWHGLTVLVRPLLALFGVKGVRAVAFVAAVGGIVWLSRVLYQRSGRGGHLVALWSPLALSGAMPQFLWACNHAFILAVGWAGAAAVGLQSHKHGWKAAVAASVFAGAAYGFVHRAAYTAGVCAVTAATAFVCSKDRRVGADLLAPMVAWPIGFGAMWASKWLWVIATNPHTDVIGTIVNRIAQKSVGDYSRAGDWDRDSGLGAWEVVEVWLQDRPLARIVAIGVAVFLIAVIVRGLWNSIIPALVVMTAAGALMLSHNNHLDGHVWFEFRIVPMIIGAMLLVSVTHAQQRHRRNDTRRQGQAPRLSDTTDGF